MKQPLKIIGEKWQNAFLSNFIIHKALYEKSLPSDKKKSELRKKRKKSFKK